MKFGEKRIVSVTRRTQARKEELLLGFAEYQWIVKEAILKKMLAKCEVIVQISCSLFSNVSLSVVNYLR